MGSLRLPRKRECVSLHYKNPVAGKADRSTIMPPHPELCIVYFTVRARQEVALMALPYGNIPYTVKGTQEFLGMGFGEAKQGGHLPFGQLPLLEVGGKGGRIIAQSGAINRYVAGLSGLVPADTVAYCDLSVYHHFNMTLLVDPTAFSDYPTIAPWMARIESVPGVKEYLENRPDVIGV